MYVFAMTTDHAPAGSATVDLPQGKLAYRVAGPATSDRPPVVLVHGLLVDARLWEPVAERLAARASAATRRRCRSARTSAR